MTTTIDPPRAAAPGLPAPTRHAALAPVMVGLGAFLVSAIAIGVPSMWGDEAASVMSARRPWESLWAMSANVDAVHVVYYAMLHVWVDVFGASSFSVRLPSALAIGATAAGVFTLCRFFVGGRIALLASIVPLLVPRIVFMSGEARSAALSAALVTWLTVLLVHLVRTRGTRAGWWVLYAGLLVISVHVFLYTALIAAAHLLTLVVMRAPREIWWRWAVASVAAGIACLPFAMLATSQHGQIAFLARRDVMDPDMLFVKQWFGSLPIALFCWAAIVFAIAWAVRSWRRRPQREDEAGTRLLVWISVLWLLVPMAALLLANIVAGPLYTGRYLSFSAPAAGILIALALAQLRPRRAAIVAGALALVLAVPFAISQRTENAKFGSDWAQVSEYVGAHSRPGDGVVFDDGVRPSRKPRLALHLYPEGFRDTADLGLVRSYDTTDGLWDTVKPLAELPGVLDDHQRVWVVARSQDGTSDDERTLQQAGYRLTDTRWLARDVILLYTKGTP